MQGLDFLERLAAASAVEEVLALLCGAGEAVGMTAIAIGAPHRNGDFAPFWHSNWPQDWLDLYVSEGFAAHDPVGRVATRLIAPVTWSDIRDGKAGVAMDADARRVFEAGATFGFHEGIVVPIHGPGAYLAVASFVGGPRGFSRAEAAGLQLAAFYAHERLRALQPRRRLLDSPLSAREIESLEWVLVGLTDDGVAERMRISPRTARFHLDNARAKLGCRTRAQAAAAALALGLLRP